MLSLQFLGGLIIIMSAPMAVLSVSMYNYAYCVSASMVRRKEIIRQIITYMMVYLAALSSAYAGIILYDRPQDPIPNIIALITFALPVIWEIGYYIKRQDECIPISTLTGLVGSYIFLIFSHIIQNP